MEKDHPDQAVDTDIPDGETVDMEAWEAMRDAAIAAEAEEEE